MATKRPPKGYRFYVRKFLNKPGQYSNAYILAEIEDRSSNKNYTDLTLKIGDCERSVSLSLPLNTPADRRNTLYKLDTLIRTLIEFEDGVQEVVNGCKG